MDVHVPDHPLHTTRDFLLHLFTITVGLFIALMLEAGVEALHHRHLLHQAEANLTAELHENRVDLAKDERQLDRSEAALSKNITLLTALKAHQGSAEPPDFYWYWNGMQTAAWDTARDTGAIALMSYDHAQGYAVIYGQQSIVDEQAKLYIRDIYRSGGALQGRQVSDLQPADIDTMIAGTQQALVDLKLLEDLCHSLDRIYQNADHNP